MIAIPLVLGPGAFVGGLYLARRFAPPLADTPVGVAASRVTELLVGAAASVVALHVFLTIRAATAYVYEGFSAGDAAATQFVDALWQAGLLLAAAAAVHLLAPPPESSEP